MQSKESCHESKHILNARIVISYMTWQIYLPLRNFRLFCKEIQCIVRSSSHAFKASILDNIVKY